MKKWIHNQDFLRNIQDQIARIDLHYDNRELIKLLKERGNPKISCCDLIKNFINKWCCQKYFSQVTERDKIKKIDEKLQTTMKLQ